MRLAWQSDDARWRASLRATLVQAWDERDENSGPLFKPAGYATFDVHVTRQLTEAVRIRAGINNLTDRTYWQWTRAGGLSPEDPTIPFLSQPARSFALGIDVAW